MPDKDNYLHCITTKHITRITTIAVTVTAAPPTDTCAKHRRILSQTLPPKPPPQKKIVAVGAVHTSIR